MVGGLQADGVGASWSCLAVAPDDKLVSVLGRRFQNTPSILPVRGHLDAIKCLMKGDLYIGRGCRQRGLSCSQFANPYKVAKFGRSRAIELFSTFLQDNAQLRSALWTLSGLRLVCHCGPQQPCHADVLISAYSHSFPGAFDRDDPHSGVPPTSDQLNYLAELREEHGSSEGSTADEDAAPAGSGWKGSGKPMQVGIGYTVRDFCDGQSLASPGRWAPSDRRYPQSDAWSAVVVLVKRFSEVFGTTKLLMDLALGRIKECPFPIEAVNSLKKEIVDSLSSRGLNLKREEGDRDELPIDFRFLDLLLRAAHDPDRQLGSFAQGVKVGPGTRMPRHPALYRPNELAAGGRASVPAPVASELRITGGVRR